ncbi:DsbE family thiol:disulfide interchange protein [uncultured Roseovarius sp.]|uniref:DsbE family thiol:disulfide interchange protein n=1 Tax=uncultured Roseovarius sp. TaxID=293344 RepID=UPI0026361247|nr:DsbE family thiol:disulfide interchange protein [uncultured Roseovarius sp.]
MVDTPTDNAGRTKLAITGKRLIMLIPVVAFVGLGFAFVWGLTRAPGTIPSTMVGKLVPEFVLPPVQGRVLGLSSYDLHGEVSLVNVFASWCTACRQEHPLFMDIAQQGRVPVHGLNYKDRPADAAAWLDTLGDPYGRTGADLNGRVAIEWGVYGVPETYVVGADGRIAYKHVGPVTESILKETVLPLVDRLRGVKREPAS